MKTPRFLIVPLVLLLALSALPARASADEYDESQSHPLRITAYILHPFGRLMEWVVSRPFHALVSGSKELEYIFGHRPHPPLFDPRPYSDYGVSKRDLPPSKEAASKEAVAKRAAPPKEPVPERVVVKEVTVEKTVVKEVPKIVEVEKVVFPEVAFRFDSAELTDLGRGRVYLAAQKLKEKSDIVVEIEGHADFIGSEEYNIRLGLRRAETVKKELQRLGIEPQRISVTSLGESKPVIDRETDWARAVNRRAAFRVSSP
ncbi:MAG: OmpA family protein [Candidatus Binatia bacterium]